MEQQSVSGMLRAAYTSPPASDRSNRTSGESRTTEIIQHFQPLLRKYEQDDELTILHTEEQPGCKVGDNYMSVVVRMKVTGKRGDGTTYRKWFMTKYFPRHRRTTSFIRTSDLFSNEAFAYENLLPILGDFGPACVHADPEHIVMEDLKPLGYVLCERRNLLDLDHCIVAVKTLAELHASSLALKLKDPARFRQLIAPLKEAVFPQDPEPALGTCIEGSFKSAIEHLESLQPQTEELRGAIEYLNIYRHKTYDIMRDLVVPGQSRYDVITHGDAWNNNILFKYDATGKVISAKLLDYQTMRHVSAAIDFHYFMYSSPKSSIIEHNYDDLKKAYHSEFIDNVKKLSVLESDISKLTLGWFESELQKCSKYGLFTGFWLAPALLVEDDEAIDMDGMTTADFEKFDDMLVKIRPKIAERVKCIALHYMRQYSR